MGKTFKTQAVTGATQFITTPPTGATAEAKARIDTDPAREFYRLNLKLKPELRQYLADLSWYNRATINDVVNHILTEYMENHRLDA